MQLKIQRSQRAGITNTIMFCLDIRADYSAEEQHNIQKYKIGSQSIYNSRAAEKHFAAASAQFDQTQLGTTGQRMGGLLKGAFSTALAHMQLNVTVGSLAKGHHIECKDLEELLEAEDVLRKACKNLTRFLEVADTFNGSELVVTYENGEESVHVAQNMPPLLSVFEPAPVPANTAQVNSPNVEAQKDEDDGQRTWKDPQIWITAAIGGSIALGAILLNLFK